MADEKSADPATSLEVDLMILDYLMYSATKALLDVHSVHKEQKYALRNGRHDMLINMVDSFLVTFEANHPNYQAHDDLKLSLQLLKFVILFTQRYEPCPTTPSPTTLKDKRQGSALRVEEWLRHRNVMPPNPKPERRLSLVELHRNRQAVLSRLRAGPADDPGFFGTPSSVSLLDLLPMFMSLSATKAHQAHWNINDTWMGLAAEFMLQAAVEQYWIYGASWVEPVGVAFAWGWVKREDWGELNEDEMVNEMFRQEGGQFEIPRWAEIRQDYMNALVHGGEDSKMERITEIMRIHPLDDFEASMVSFLAGILKSLNKPILVQMETGSVEGLSSTETKALKTRLGWK